MEHLNQGIKKHKRVMLSAHFQDITNEHILSKVLQELIESPQYKVDQNARVKVKIQETKY